MSKLSYFYGICAAMFLATFLVNAAVRWFHMCKPFNSAPRYYYPGRPYVTGVFLSSILIIPYIINPESADAWYLARIFILPTTIFHYIILQFSYFGSVMQWRRWKAPVLLTALPVFLGVVPAEILTFVPGDQIGTIINPALASWTLYSIGAIETLVCIASMVVVLLWAERYDADEFSNRADFPVVFARRWMFLVFFNQLFVWTAALTNSQLMVAITMLLLALSSIIFIISALHPNRNRPVGDKEVPEDAPKIERAYQRTLSNKTHQEILAAILTVVVEQRAYLEPHLTIQDVADRCGYNRSYVAGIFKGEFNGFFNYINTLRLEHAENYLKAHPDATIQEAVYESGFASRQAYYAFKGKKD